STCTVPLWTGSDGDGLAKFGLPITFRLLPPTAVPPVSVEAAPRLAVALEVAPALPPEDPQAVSRQDASSAPARLGPIRNPVSVIATRFSHAGRGTRRA